MREVIAAISIVLGIGFCLGFLTGTTYMDEAQIPDQSECLVQEVDFKALEGLLASGVVSKVVRLENRVWCGS